MTLTGRGHGTVDMYFPAGYVDLEDFILCKNESGGDPGACLKEGRRITRCAADL